MEAEKDPLARSVLPHCGEVAHFVTYDSGYYAILRSGERLDIVFIHAFQPEILDFDDYYSYLFIQTDLGFYLLRQRIAEGRPCGWRSLAEIVPEARTGFFKRAVWEPGFLDALAAEAAVFDDSADDSGEENCQEANII